MLLFSIYSKISLCKKLRKPQSKSCEKCVTDGRTDRQSDKQTNRTDSIGPLFKRCRFDHVFWKFDNKIFLNNLDWLWALWKKISVWKRNTIAHRMHPPWQKGGSWKKIWLWWLDFKSWGGTLPAGGAWILRRGGGAKFSEGARVSKGTHVFL